MRAHVGLVATFLSVLALGAPALAGVPPEERGQEPGGARTSTAAPTQKTPGTTTPPPPTSTPLPPLPPATLREPPGATEPEPASPSQIKGELIHIGTRELVSRFDHAGVRVGPHVIDKDFFLGVTPGAAVYTGEWGFAFQVPLNLLLLEAGRTELGSFKIRREDWDEVSDYARIVRFITYGRKESELYFSINSLRPTTLGHGQLMRNYQPNIDVDRSMTGVVLEAYNDFGGFQLNLNDVTFENRVLGGLLFVKPFGFVSSAGPLLRSISLGVEYAGDLRAPGCIQASVDDPRCILGGPSGSRPEGNRAGPDPLTGRSRDDTFVRTDPDLGRPVIEERTVQAIGLSAELKVYQDDRSSIKPYLTWHSFIDGGNGAALGVLGRFTTGDELLNGFRVRVEGRSFGDRFIPGYFDTLYEVTKYQYPAGARGYQVLPTKAQAIFGDDDNGFPLTDTGRHLGTNLELSWALFDGERSKKLLAAGFGLTDSSADDDTDFYAHVEFPGLEWFQVFATYIRLNASGIGGLFQAEEFDAEVGLVGARLQVLPFLFLNAHYSNGYQILRAPGHELHLGNERVVDERGLPSRYFAENRLFERVSTLFVEIELGAEFRE